MSVLEGSTTRTPNRGSRPGLEVPEDFSRKLYLTRDHDEWELSKAMPTLKVLDLV